MLCNWTVWREVWSMGLHMLMPTSTPAAPQAPRDAPPWCAPAFPYLSPHSSSCHPNSQHPSKGSMQAFPFVSTSKRPCKTTNAYKAHLLISSGLHCPPKSLPREDKLSVTCEMKDAGSILPACTLAVLYSKCLPDKLHKIKHCLENHIGTGKNKATTDAKISFFHTNYKAPCQCAVTTGCQLLTFKHWAGTEDICFTRLEIKKKKKGMVNTQAVFVAGTMCFE